ncbi:hypothetical protein [Nocardia rhizosphaerihabitans]|nr:hypothetical protein [Nocardia rhizosphaerihabitans]
MSIIVLHPGVFGGAGSGAVVELATLKGIERTSGVGVVNAGQ